jgi:hypothetical protein
MSARPAPSRRTAARPTTPRPKGTRLPHPGALTRFAQWLALACVLLALAGLYLRPWAEQRLAEQAATTHAQRLDSHARFSSDAAARLPLPTLPPLEVAAPQLVRWLYAPPRSTLLWLIAALDIALIAAEVGLNIWVLFYQARRMRSIPTTYLRVRAPAPPISMSGRALGAGGTPSGDQFFRAIQKDGIPLHFWRRFTGTAPWVAFTLTGLPDEPIELGIVVASTSDRQREDMAMAIRTVIQGQAPGAQLEQHPDPLIAALEIGEHPRVVGWCDYGIALPPHYPLRFVEDIEGSDLLGPLAAALAPHGTLRVEAQISSGSGERSICRAAGDGTDPRSSRSEGA